MTSVTKEMMLYSPVIIVASFNTHCKVHVSIAILGRHHLPQREDSLSSIAFAVVFSSESSAQSHDSSYILGHATTSPKIMLGHDGPVQSLVVL